MAQNSGCFEPVRPVLLDTHHARAAPLDLLQTAAASACTAPTHDAYAIKLLLMLPMLPESWL
jgi:hypothetical protein